MKKVISLLALCAVLLSGCAAGSEVSLQSALEEWKSESFPQNEQEQSSDTVILRLTHSSAKDSLADSAAQIFAERLETLSNGKIQVEIYPDNTLGTLDKAYSFGNGRVDLRLGITGAPYSNIVMWLPLLSGASLETIENAYEAGSEMRKLVQQNAQEQNMRILAVLPMQYRELASTFPVESEEDFQKLKMRVYGQTGPNFIFWEGLCRETVKVNIDNVPLSLQMGSVNACDNTLENLREYNIEEKISDITELPFVLYFDSLCIDQGTYDRLGEAQRRQVRQAAAYTEEVLYSSRKNSAQQLREEMEQEGIRFHTLPEEVQQNIRSRVQPGVYEYFCNAYGEDTVQAFIGEVSLKE